MFQLDLRTALTDEAVALARPHLGNCTYSAPCIIGAMLPEDLREELDLAPVDLIENIDAIEFPTERQRRLAGLLQHAFDIDDEAEFDHTLARVRRELADD